MLKIESLPLSASKKQSNEIHRNLLVDQSTTSTIILLLGYNSFTAVSFIHNTYIHSFVYPFFNQSFIHSKINFDGQEHLICCKLIRYCQVGPKLDRTNKLNHLLSRVGFVFPSNQANICLSALAETTFVIL